MVALFGVLKLLIVKKHDQQEQQVFHGWSSLEYNNNTRPLYVIFHVGPAKMGSTSIQIGALEKYHKQLVHDKYNVHDFRDASKLNQCLSRDAAKCQNDQEWNSFQRFIQKSKRQGRHVLISTENHWNFLSNDTSLLSTYHDLFSRHDYQVRIVIGYRPLFDYWPSVYFQEYSHYCGYSHAQEETRVIPPFLEFMERANETKQLRHPSYAAVQYAQQYFSDIVILPLGSKFVERFLCQAVMRATRACAAAVLGHTNETVENARHSLVSDRLAQAARTHGLSQKPCKVLSQHFQQEENATVLLPRTCLNKSQQDWLWDKTLFYHHALIAPNNASTVSDQELKRQFDEAASTSLCQVNVEQVLQTHPDLFAGKNATSSSPPP